MFDSLNTRITRLYNNIIGRVKNIDSDRQTISGTKNPEFMHSLATAPEYHAIDKFALEISKQLPPTTADSIRNSDIGSLEDWGQKVIGRSILPDESIADYRQLILDAWKPEAKGGDRADLLEWSLEVSDIRRVYPCVSGCGHDQITVDDIEGRLAGSALYVRTISGNGVPSIAKLQEVADRLQESASISVYRLNPVPVIERYYDFVYTVSENVTGGSSSLSEVQSKVVDITIDILDKTEPYIKYVDGVRRDFVIAGQYLNEIRNVITKPPYRYSIDDIRVFQDGIEIQIDQLPSGNIPILGEYTFA